MVAMTGQLQLDLFGAAPVIDVGRWTRERTPGGLPAAREGAETCAGCGRPLEPFGDRLISLACPAGAVVA